VFALPTSLTGIARFSGVAKTEKVEKNRKKALTYEQSFIFGRCFIIDIS
jgi:hypothetical protein